MQENSRPLQVLTPLPKTALPTPSPSAFKLKLTAMEEFELTAAFQGWPREVVFNVPS